MITFIVVLFVAMFLISLIWSDNDYSMPIGFIFGLIVALIVTIFIGSLMPKAFITEEFQLSPIYSENGNQIYLTLIDEEHDRMLLYHILDQEGIPREKTITVGNSVKISFDAGKSWMEHSYQKFAQKWYSFIGINWSRNSKYVFHLNEGEVDINLNDLLK